jgi:hypothetical protein
VQVTWLGLDMTFVPTIAGEPALTILTCVMTLRSVPLIVRSSAPAAIECVVGCTLAGEGAAPPVLRDVSVFHG